MHFWTCSAPSGGFMKKLSVESIFCQMATFSLHQNGVNEAKISRVIFFSINFCHRAWCWVMLVSKSALVTITVYQIQKVRLLLFRVFNQEFKFCLQLFFTSLFRNSIFLHFEARLSSIMQNWKKLLSFHYCLPKGVTDFQDCILNLHNLNYHIGGHPFITLEDF